MPPDPPEAPRQPRGRNTGQRPNVLLIVFDTARQDAFSPYGAPASATPAVAQLGRRGFAHRRIYAPACWTVPSHGSMFSGLLPRSAGLAHIGGGTPADFRRAIADRQPRWLPAVLNLRGYSTAAVSANGWVHRSSGFDLGFERFRHVGGHRHNGLTNHSWRHRARWYLDALRAHLDDGAAMVEHQIHDWLAERDGRPFFWFVNLVECHSPYLPPRPFNRLPPGQRLRAAVDARRHLTLEGIWKASIDHFNVTEEALVRMRAGYTAAISQMDSWLARVLEALDAKGILEETEVMVTSDHGENLGEGAMLGHNFSLDDRLLRVPFVAAGPLDLTLPRLASLAHVPNAIASAIGLEDHPWQADVLPANAAVAQFDAPGTMGDPKTEQAVLDWGLSREARETLCTSFVAATDGRLKLVRRGVTEELFDLTVDPGEEAPLTVSPDHEREHASALSGLRTALDDAEAAELPNPGVLTISNDDVGSEETAELEEQMRLLGYL